MVGEERLKLEEEDLPLNSEDENRLVEEARPKADQEYQELLKAEEEACLVKYSRQEAKEHKHE